MRVFVYWNLHKHLFSVRNTKTGLVVDHARRVKMTDVTFAVGQKGRERVLAEGRKNVHAGVRGEQVEVHRANLRGYERMTYNPYKHTTFVRASDQAPVEGADMVLLLIREDGRAQIWAKGLRILELSA